MATKVAKKASKTAKKTSPKSLFYYGDVLDRSGDRRFQKVEIPFELIDGMRAAIKRECETDPYPLDDFIEQHEDQLPPYVGTWDWEEILKACKKPEDFDGYYTALDEIMFGLGLTKQTAKKAYQKAFDEFEGVGDDDDWD